MASSKTAPRFRNAKTIIRFGAAVNQVEVSAYDTKEGVQKHDVYDFADVVSHKARQLLPFSRQAHEEERTERHFRGDVAAAICELHGIHGEPKRKHHRHRAKRSATVERTHVHTAMGA